MVSIDTYNACVDFPIFDAKSRSLKKAMMSSAGGKIGQNASNTVVVEALRDINLHLREGDRVGLVGHNGAGKTTLLRLLSGIYEPTRGVADVRGRVAPVFDLGVGMDPEISGYENIIIRGPEILLLDEGIGAVDAAFMSKARVRLAEMVERSGILVFASHSNDFLAQLCNTALWVDKGEIREAGLVADVVRAYEGPEAGDHVAELVQRFHG